jgi:hypothetical protein
MVLALPLDEASVKVRDGGVEDNPVDLGKGVWSGVLPLRMVVDTPVPTDEEAAALPLPQSVLDWIESPKA